MIDRRLTGRPGLHKRDSSTGDIEIVQNIMPWSRYSTQLPQAEGALNLGKEILSDPRLVDYSKKDMGYANTTLSRRMPVVEILVERSERFGTLRGSDIIYLNLVWNHYDAVRSLNRRYHEDFAQEVIQLFNPFLYFANRLEQEKMENLEDSCSAISIRHTITMLETRRMQLENGEYFWDEHLKNPDLALFARLVRQFSTTSFERDYVSVLEDNARNYLEKTRLRIPHAEAEAQGQDFISM